MPTNRPERLISDMRNVRYGEIIALYAHEVGFRAEVWGTQMLNDCPQELWETLDPGALALELDAVLVKLNGPRHWTLDGLGQKIAVIEPTFREFNGLMMRRIATIDLGDNPGALPYTEVKVDRGAIFFFDAGSEVFELINPDGLVYLMQAYCIGVDPTITLDSLGALRDTLDPPAGWTFRARTLAEELIIDTSDTVATVLQDEKENSYSLIS